MYTCAYYVLCLLDFLLFPGWFKISKGLEFSKPIPHKSIETLTRCTTEFFLCTIEFDAVVITDTIDGDDNETTSFIRPVVEGEVLRKTGVQKLNRLLLPEPERSTCTDDRFLMCIDERDCELFVPVSQTGLFYEVSDGNFSKSENSVVQISDVLDELVEFPLYVRHILGDPPPISKLYLPSLKLVRVNEEETVMGSTLECDDDKLPLEIQTNSSVRFEIALNTPMLQSSNGYIEALDLCNSVNQNYVSEMKLAVNFKMADSEDALQTLVRNRVRVADENDNLRDSRTDSQRTSIMGKDSEYGEEEANSEFSIQWEPNPSSRNTPVNQDQSLEEGNGLEDCVSIESFESVDAEHAARLNSVLGGTYFDTEHRPSSVNNSNSSNSHGGPYANDGFSLGRGVLGHEFGADVVEETTDFSMRRNPQMDTSVMCSDAPMAKRRFGSYPDRLNNIRNANQTQPFDTDMRKPEESNSDMLTRNSQFILRGEGDCVNVTSTSCSAHQPDVENDMRYDISQSSFGVRSCDNSVQVPVTNTVVNSQGQMFNLRSLPQVSGDHHTPYIFTGDVFINNDSCDSVNSKRFYSSNDSLPESIGSWDTDKLTIAQNQSPTEINGRTHPPPDIVQQVKSIHSRSIQSPDNLITFEERSRTPSASSIVTCKAADEMVSSCKDLRLSLNEITQNAHDNHTESSWNEFCLERSSSLPVRSKTSPRKPASQTEEQSHSWEQISPRREDVTSHPSSLQKKKEQKQTNTIEKRNIKYDTCNGDKAQLILDTSSDDSTVFDETLPGDFSFTFSESDLSITDGQDNLMEAFEEMDGYFDAQSPQDASVRNAQTLTRDKAVLTQKMKIRREIRRKQLADWNETVEII